MHVLLSPREIVPQLLHVFIVGLKELKPIKTRVSNKRGIRNKSNKMLPRKLMKKLNPKIAITINIINE